MKMTFQAVLTGACLLAVVCPMSASAQTSQPSRGGSAPAASSGPHKVGLVDVGYIFDNYKKLEAQRTALQAEIEASQNDPEIANIRQQVETLKGQLEKVTAGSEKASQLEQEMIQVQAQGQARLANLKREFMRKEVTMYKEIYEEVTRMVELYAKGNRYTLVLRYQREPEGEAAEAENPQMMMARVNQLVVFHQEGDDMTQKILDYMNEQYAKAGGQTGAGAAATSRPTTQTAAGSTAPARN